MQLVDSHCHFSFKDLAEYNTLTTDNNLKNAAENNVKHMMDIATEIDMFDKAIEFSSKHSNIFTSLGLHPCEITKESLRVFSVDFLTNYLNSSKKVVGIGETGLDYHKDYGIEVIDQKSVFEIHLEAAKKTKLPVVIHTRDAFDDTLNVLTNYFKNSGVAGVIHCFSGTVAEAKKYLDIGYYISFSGTVTFKNATELHDVAKYVPLERLLIETDSPYLAPVPFRGKTNEPANVLYVAKQIALLKNTNLEDIALNTTSNFFTLFNKASLLIE